MRGQKRSMINVQPLFEVEGLRLNRPWNKVEDLNYSFSVTVPKEKPGNYIRERTTQVH